MQLTWKTSSNSLGSSKQNNVNIKASTNLGEIFARNMIKTIYILKIESLYNLDGQ